MKKKVMDFLKRETVLSIALLLAVISMFFVFPDKEYIGYIDFKTLAILFCLMAVMEGLREIGVFTRMAQELLTRAGTIRQIIFVLTMLCFFVSMVVTNDVALITFVPLTITVLNMMGQKEKWLVVIVVMQTIAANLGSMLTPIGNPQNLYLYGLMQTSVGGFMALMLPYTAMAFVLMIIWIILRTAKCRDKVAVDFGEKQHFDITVRKKALYYTILFIGSILVVARLVPWQLMLCIVVVAMWIIDRNILKKVDYSLLLTFVGFFVFIGNMGRLEAFHNFLGKVVAGREILTAVISSQVISNVPAALLLSGFTDNIRALTVGVDIGGLGTLIASMASLISFKYVAVDMPQKKGAYILKFTEAGLAFLVAMICVCYITGII